MLRSELEYLEQRSEQEAHHADDDKDGGYHREYSDKAAVHEHSNSIIPNSMGLLQRKILAIPLLALAIWFGYKGIAIREARMEMKDQVADLESRVNDLKRNNQFLASSSAYFGSDAYLERQARLKLNYKLPDEQVAFVYKDATAKKIASESSLEVQLADMPNWKKWWYYILGY